MKHQMLTLSVVFATKVGWFLLDRACKQVNPDKNRKQEILLSANKRFSAIENDNITKHGVYAITPLANSALSQL